MLHKVIYELSFGTMTFDLLSNGIMESFVSSHLKSHFTLDMDHIESCGYFSNDKDIDM